MTEQATETIAENLGTIIAGPHGVFIGEFNGMSFWSNADAVSHTHVATFSSRDEARSYLEKSGSNPDDYAFHEVSVDPLIKRVSREQCVELGFDPWFVDTLERELVESFAEIASDRPLIVMTAGTRLFLVDVNTGLVMITSHTNGQAIDYRGDTAGNIVRFDPKLLQEINEAIKNPEIAPEIIAYLDPGPNMNRNPLPGDALTFWTSEKYAHASDWTIHEGIDNLDIFVRTITAPAPSMRLN